MKVIDVNELLKLINYNLQISLECFEEIDVPKEVKKAVRVFSTTLLTMIIQESQAYEVDEANLTETEHDELLKAITNCLLMDSKDYKGENQTYEC